MNATAKTFKDELEVPWPLIEPELPETLDSMIARAKGETKMEPRRTRSYNEQRYHIDQASDAREAQAERTAKWNAENKREYGQYQESEAGRHKPRWSNENDHNGESKYGSE